MVDALSAKIEMELGELEPDEAGVFMDELGITESSLDRVIALSYRLLGLVSFLTAGPDEVRAWPIRDGSTAVDAAGAIHTDLAKGFIRAETVAYDDLLTPRLDGRGAQGRSAALGGRRPTGSRTATCWRSCSAAESPAPRPTAGNAVHQFDREPPSRIESAGSSSRTWLLVGFVSSSSSSSSSRLELGEEVLVLLRSTR